MKRQKRLLEREKPIGESSLTPLGMGAVAIWSWVELMDGFAVNAFQVQLVSVFIINYKINNKCFDKYHLFWN